MSNPVSKSESDVKSAEPSEIGPNVNGLGSGLGSGLDSVLGQLSDFKLALDKAAIVAVTDRAGKITHVNDKFCKVSKYAREELLGQNHRIIKSNHHPKEFFVNMWRTISSGQVWEGEICNRAKDGSLYWVNTCIVPFVDNEGRPYQYVSIRFEVTQQKNAEDQLRSHTKKLEESNRDLEHFASIAAHDLQEPLRKIRAFSDRLTKKCKDILPPDAVDYLDRIQAAAERMQNLIEDLLTYSSIRKTNSGFSSTNLAEIVREVLNDFELKLEQTHAVVNVESLPIIQADPSQIRQLLMNLIGNAIKFRAPDRPLIITITALTELNKVHISIKDNGIGFDEKYLDRIFTIFQRLHGRSEYPGTGVGLAICRRIVERHDGTITAKSQPGQGAEFIVTLPHIKN
jgi:two-component system, LuxR family, sensor kinase FixL